MSAETCMGCIGRLEASCAAIVGMGAVVALTAETPAIVAIAVALEEFGSGITAEMIAAWANEAMAAPATANTLAATICTAAGFCP